MHHPNGCVRHARGTYALRLFIFIGSTFPEETDAVVLQDCNNQKL